MRHTFNIKTRIPNKILWLSTYMYVDIIDWLNEHFLLFPPFFFINFRSFFFLFWRAGQEWKGRAGP